MSLESKLVSIAHKIKDGIVLAGEDAIKVAAFLQQNAVEIAGLSALAGSKTSNVVAVGQTVLSAVVAAVKSAGDAAGANGLSVQLDASVIAAVKAIIKDIESL